MKDYSQNGEQRYILDYFNGHTGTYADIGANDGRTFSNTHALALMGWQGLCVEPTPKAFENLSILYAERPDIQRIEAAITAEDGPVKMQVASDTLVSSLDVAAPSVWGAYGFTWTEIEVDGISFATLMERSVHKAFEFINIDTEGHDIAILEQMDLNALGCRMLCIEHGSKFDRIKELCVGMREVHRNGMNMILAR